MGYGRFGVPGIALGRGHECLELGLVIAGLFDQQPRIVAKVRQPFGR